MARYRDRNSLITRTWSISGDAGGGGDHNPWADGGSLSWRTIDSMEDVVTPRFRIRSAEGEIINSPMTTIKSTTMPVDLSITANVSGNDVYASFAYKGVVLCPEAQSLWDWTPGDGGVARVEALATTKAYAEVGKKDFGALEELVELRDTLAFLASPVNQMVRLTNRGKSWLASYRRVQAANERRFAAWERRARRLAKRGKPEPPKPAVLTVPPFKVGRLKASDIASFWLAYRYGLMPLIYSFQDIQKVLEKYQKEPQRVRATARGTASVSEEHSSSWGYQEVGGHGVSVGGEHKFSWTVTSTARAGVLYEYTATLSNQLGLQMHQIPAALWEGIPLSFVADWFWTGSTAYQALTAHLRADRVLASWVTTKVNLQGQSTWEPELWHMHGYTSGTFSCSSNILASYSHTVKQRRATDLSDVRAQFVVELSPARVADGLALVYNFLVSDAGVKRRAR